MNSTEMRPGLTFINNWAWVCTRARNEQISTLYQINYLFWLDNFRVLGRFLYSYSLNSANQNTVFKFKVFWLDDFRVRVLFLSIQIVMLCVVVYLYHAYFGFTINYNVSLNVLKRILGEIYLTCFILIYQPFIYYKR
jgi:hypothetical protein